MSVVKITGVRKAISNIVKVTTATSRALTIATLQGGLWIEASAKRNAPVKYGNLKGSIFTRGQRGAGTKPSFPQSTPELQEGLHQVNTAVDKILKKANVPTVTVGVGANYGIYVEELHKTNGKFLARAIKSNKDKIEKNFKSKLKKAMKIL